MALAYRELFAAQGTRGFALAGALARLPLPMTGIGIITMLSQLRGDYALAGAVSATFVLSYALLSPQISKRVDRLGQYRVLPQACAVSLAGFVLLLAAGWWQGPDALFFAGALLAGFMPSMSAMVRARWTALYRGQPQLQTAYSLETVLDEMSFIAGPPLSVGLAVALAPQAGLLMAAILLAAGTLALVLQRSSEPSPAVAGVHRQGWVLRRPGMAALTLLMVAMGVIVGTVDIVSVAFSTSLGRPASASFILSAYAVGSCAAGLIFGALSLPVSLPRLLLLGGLATALSTLPMALAGSIPSLALAVLVAGLFFAPTMIVAMALVETIVEADRLTEGLTWLLAGLNAGVALGAAVSGAWIDHAGARAGLDVALTGAGLVLAITLWTAVNMKKPRPGPGLV